MTAITHHTPHVGLSCVVASSCPQCTHHPHLYPMQLAQAHANSKPHAIVAAWLHSDDTQLHISFQSMEGTSGSSHIMPESRSRTPPRRRWVTWDQFVVLMEDVQRRGNLSEEQLRLLFSQYPQRVVRGQIQVRIGQVHYL